METGAEAEVLQDMFEKDKGWTAFWKNDALRFPTRVGGRVHETDNGLIVVDCGLHKFPGDEVSIQSGERFYWQDGFVLNKDVLLDKNGSQDWQEAFVKEADKKDFPSALRGGFSGLIHEENATLLYNDHVGNHAVYYYHHNGIFACSTRVSYLVELLKYNQIELHLNIQAAQYMLEYGYMLDDATFAAEIKRVLPGQKICIAKDGTEKKSRYYCLDNRHVKEDMTEEEAIALTDKYFRQAVKREFEKDREYGYRHLVHLSGGLDSRMVAWVAHDLGYTQQVNMTYCKNNYLDFQIAQKIALFLKHTFLYMPLDDFAWFRDAREMSRKNNGAALYAGITGGKRFMELLDKSMFGITHTGMVGDAVVGSFFADPLEGFDPPGGSGLAYSNKLHYEVDRSVWEQYPNKETYLLTVRGFLCAQTSYFTIQTYYETSSPFLDVDFLEAVMSIPPHLRTKHYLYLRWLEERYPEAAAFGWEKWKGMKPKVKNMKKVKRWNRFYRKRNQIKQKLGKGEPQHMNPTNYWYGNDKAAQGWAEDYFKKGIQRLGAYPKLKQDAEYLFKNGNSIEKTQVITLLIWADLF